MFFHSETRVLPRDSSGTGRFLGQLGGYAAGPSKQDVLLIAVLLRSGSSGSKEPLDIFVSGAQLLSVHSEFKVRSRSSSPLGNTEEFSPGSSKLNSLFSLFLLPIYSLILASHVLHIATVTK